MSGEVGRLAAGLRTPSPAAAPRRCCDMLWRAATPAEHAALRPRRRVLGTLMPLQSVEVAIKHHPELLAVALGTRRDRVERLLGRLLPSAPSLALASVLGARAALLLAPPARLAARWRTLEQAAAAVPQWGAQLAALRDVACAPLEARERGELGGDAAAPARSTARRARPPRRDAAEVAREAQAKWAEVTPEGELLKKRPRGPRPSRARREACTAIARLLSTRAWQLSRLLFVAEAHPSVAVEAELVALVRLSPWDFDQRFPGFADWQEARAEARAARRAEWEASGCTAKAGHDEGDEGVEHVEDWWPAP